MKFYGTRKGRKIEKGAWISQLRLIDYWLLLLLLLLV